MRAIRPAMRHVLPPAGLSVATALLALCAPVAGAQPADESAARASFGNSGRGALGLQAGRNPQRLGCGAAALTCDRGEPFVQLPLASTAGGFWGGAEIGRVDLGHALRGSGAGQAPGLNASLVGRWPVASTGFGVYGRVGATTFSRPDTALLGAGALPGESGVGLSFGAGVSYDFTPRLAAQLEVDSHSFALPGSGAREPVRGASLGLQYRY